MLKSDFCEYSGAYIVVKRRISVRAVANTDIEKNTALTNKTPSKSCMSKVKNSLIANGEDLVNEYVVMSMNNLLEYSDNYSRTLRNLRNCYIGEIDNVDNDALGVKSFKLKTKIIRKTPAQTL